MSIDLNRSAQPTVDLTRPMPPSRPPARTRRSHGRLDRLALSYLCAIALFGSITVVLLVRPPPDRPEHHLPLASDADRPAIEGLLDRVHEKYVRNLDRFDTNLKLQALMMVFGLLVLVRRTDPLEFAGTQIPLRWLHLLVPAVLLYLWLVFGFLLDDLIEGRHQGYELLASLGRRSVPAGHERIFHDAGLIDGWFVTFIDRAGTYMPPSIQDGSFAASTSLFLVLVLGLFVGGAHAIMLAVLIVEIRRHQSRPRSRFSQGRALTWFVIALFLLVISHLQFAYGGANRNWLQPAVGVIAPVLVFALVRTALGWDHDRCRRRRDVLRVGSDKDGGAAGLGK